MIFGVKKPLTLRGFADLRLMLENGVYFHMYAVKE
jgi:hypothetical protein